MSPCFEGGLEWRSPGFISIPNQGPCWGTIGCTVEWSRTQSDQHGVSRVNVLGIVIMVVGRYFAFGTWILRGSLQVRSLQLGLLPYLPYRSHNTPRRKRALAEEYGSYTPLKHPPEKQQSVIHQAQRTKYSNTRYLPANAGKYLCLGTLDPKLMFASFPRDLSRKLQQDGLR